MTAKLLALYTQPENPAEFDRLYFETHMPLVRKMPGLKACRVQKFTGNLMAKTLPYYMQAELVFESLDALQAALKSPEGQAAGQNIMGFAAKYIQMLTTEEIAAEDFVPLAV